MVALISVDDHPFFFFFNFLDLTCHLEDKEIGEQEDPPSAGKNTGCIPTAISSGVDISEVPGCHRVGQIGSQ